ncbi:MAG: acyltransferase [Lachnospiraceae bacterium]|nr:acyltransferase [Lachnospiraceae bacterium]
MTESNKNKFTMDDTWALKGIAILLMLFHHSFLSPQRYAGDTVIFSPFSETFINQISSASKICVSLFVFVTGFGLAISFSKVKDGQINKWIGTRLIRVMSGFWFVFFLSNVICQIIDGRPWNIYFAEGIVRGVLYFLTDFLGLSSLLGTPSLCGTWWYMSIAVLFVLIVPILVWIDRKFGLITMLCISFFAYIILVPTEYDAKSVFTWLPVLALGVACALHNTFEKICGFFESKPVWYKCGVTLLGWCIVLLFYAKFYEISGSRYYYLRYGLFPFLLIVMLKLSVFKLKGIRGVLGWLGKYSMDIFLTHTFLRQYYLHTFIYSFKYMGGILLVLFVVSLILAIVVSELKKLMHYSQFIDWLIQKCTR